MARIEVPFELVELDPMRRGIAERTAQSFRERPHFSTTALVDATQLIALRDRLRAEGLEPLPSFNDLIIKLCGHLLTKHRHLNAWLDDEGLKLLKQVNISFAVATERGVLMPVVHEVDALPLPQLAARTRELIQLARAGRLRASLQMGGGFSISNIGPGRVEWFTAIINPPQVAILSVGSLLPRPVAAGDQVAVRPTMYFTLTVDHRAVDGAHSAAFLKDLAATAEDADKLAAALGVA